MNAPLGELFLIGSAKKKKLPAKGDKAGSLIPRPAPGYLLREGEQGKIRTFQTI